MTILVAHLRTLRTWLIHGGWPRLFLFFSSVPILWLFWGISCPSLVSGELNLINTFLAFFAVWYSLSYLQDFTRSDSSWGISGSFFLPTCPALPIGPFMRMTAEFVFFFIVLLLIFIPIFLLKTLLVNIPGQPESTDTIFLSHAIQGTFAIAPLVFCMRMLVHGTFILPAFIRMALPVLLCCAFILFQVTGLFATLILSTGLFAGQVVLLCTVFLWYRRPSNRTLHQTRSKYFSRNIFDDVMIYILLGKNNRRKVRPPETQILLDLFKIIFLYMAYWLCIYFPLTGILYYLFLNILDKPTIHLFFFFLLLILPVQDIHALKRRFLLPTIALPLRQDAVMRRFYCLFSLAIAAIWTAALLLVTLSGAAQSLSILPLTLSYAPTMAGIWINRISNKPILVFIGIGLLCSLPLGFYLGYPQRAPVLFFIGAAVGSLLPYKRLFSPASISKTS